MNHDQKKQHTATGTNHNPIYPYLHSCRVVLVTSTTSTIGTTTTSSSPHPSLLEPKDLSIPVIPPLYDFQLEQQVLQQQQETEHKNQTTTSE